MEYRIEKDTLGEVKVPKDAYYGAQTQRAVDNFPVSGLRLQSPFIKAQAIVKASAAKANMASGRLDKKVGEAIIKAASEVIDGGLADQFVVDVFQAGAGTSQNMNMNEVLANRGGEILGGKLGEYNLIHPNDHVNMGQSTNDTIPTAIHISAYGQTQDKLLPSVSQLGEELKNKAKVFDGIVKTGRTHLQDAVPMRLGQEFGAYGTMIALNHSRTEQASKALLQLAIGGSAVGTGLNTDPKYKKRVVSNINDLTGHSFKAAEDPFEAMQSMNAVVEFTGALRVLITALKKIADDLRLLSSGPRTGLAEIRLPAVQPGSSIMPGKVNPVLPEMLNMVCSGAIGCDAAINHAAQAGQLELNVMMPVIAYYLLQEIEILTGGIDAFAKKCVSGIEANEKVCNRYAERSPALATVLSPKIGYNKAAELAKEALEKDCLIRDLVFEKKILDEKTLKELLDIRKMTEEPKK